MGCCGACGGEEKKPVEQEESQETAEKTED